MLASDGPQSGTAVRLALALGCSLKPSEQQCLPSERAHRTRVWWTAYMLDRRLSANLGLPPAVDSRQISLELPTTAPGFRSSQALNVNVRLAHAAGEIMGCMYPVHCSALREPDHCSAIR
jgi:proline utilization trans-activator